MYIILVTSRYDSYERTWVRRNTLEEATKVAQNYEINNDFTCEVYEIGKDLR